MYCIFYYNINMRSWEQTIKGRVWLKVTCWFDKLIKDRLVMVIIGYEFDILGKREPHLRKCLSQIDP